MHMGAYKAVGQELPDAIQVDRAVGAFRILADPTRVRLLWLLLDAECSVNELAEALQRPQTVVSQHLAKLRLARLVDTRRSGTKVFYRVVNDHIAQLVRDGLHHAEHTLPGVPAHHRADAPSTGENE
jgi:DNA-binding transcriptional ArsR family regulator